MVGLHWGLLLSLNLALHILTNRTMTGYKKALNEFWLYKTTIKDENIENASIKLYRRMRLVTLTGSGLDPGDAPSSLPPIPDPEVKSPMRHSRSAH